MTTIHLVRHAAHDLVSRRLCGRAPGVNLGPAGLQQAEALARALPRPNRVLSSPLERARQTAQPIAAAHGLAVVEEEALMEIDFGDWTGRDFAELDPSPDWRRWNADRDQARPPNGESMLEVQIRLSRWLEALVRSDAQTIVAVSHADVIKSAVALALGLPLRAYDRFDIDPGSISTLHAAPGALKLHRLNEDPNG